MNTGTPSLGSNWTLIGSLVLLAVVVGLGAALLKAFRRPDDGPETDPNTLLTHFRELHARGELSDEEFKRIRSNLGVRIKDQADRTGHAG